MASTKKNNRTICQSSNLESGGCGFNFNVTVDGREIPGFVIRYSGTVFGYLNQCAHLMLELDWERGEFFDNSGDYIMCANHGAMFEPDTGLCINGPCYGASLTKIAVSETNSVVLLNDEQYSLAD